MHTLFRHTASLRSNTLVGGMGALILRLCVVWLLLHRYYKPGESASVPFLPFLVGVVLAMLAATVVVVQQTS